MDDRTKEYDIVQSKLYDKNGLIKLFDRIIIYMFIFKGTLHFNEFISFSSLFDEKCLYLFITEAAFLKLLNYIIKSTYFKLI